MGRMEAVVFDMDGTLLDTEPEGLVAWEQAAAQLGIEVPKGYGMKFLGISADGAAELLMADLGDQALAERFYALHRKIQIERNERNGVPAKPGALACVRRCKELGLRAAVATSSPRHQVEPELAAAGLLDEFELLVCGDEVERSKPDPQIYLTAAEHLGVEPTACYAVEDSYNGVRSGAAAGMRVAMVPDLRPATDEMRALAWGVFADLAAFSAALEKDLAGGE